MNLVTLYINDDVIGMTRIEELELPTGGYWGIQLMEKLVPDPRFLGTWAFYGWDKENAKLGNRFTAQDWVIVLPNDAFGVINIANA